MPDTPDITNLFPCPDPQQHMVFSMPAKVWDEAMAEALRNVMTTSESFRKFVEEEVVKMIKKLAPDSPRMAEIRKEASRYLERYPAIGDDLKLQEQVALTIFNYMQRETRRSQRQTL